VSSETQVLSMVPLGPTSASTSTSTVSTTTSPLSASESSFAADVAAAYPYIYTQVSVTQPVLAASSDDVDGPLPGAQVLTEPPVGPNPIALDWSSKVGYALGLSAWSIS